MADNYYTTRDAARLLGVSVRTAQQWLEKGHLAGWKTSGGHRRITRKSVESAMLAARQRRGIALSKWPLPMLIVEDDAALLRLYRANISRWPFEVTVYTASNGYEGLVMVGEVAPRLLICDLRLPGVNGFQVIRSLGAMDRYKGLSIVVVSGLPPREVDAHGGLPPGVEWLRKPIDFARLQEIARRLWHDMHDTSAGEPQAAASVA